MNRMKKVSKIILVLFILIALIYTAGISIAFNYLAAHPDKLKTIVTGAVGKKTGYDIHVKNALLQFSGKPELILTGLRLKSSESLYVKAPELKVKFSLIHMLFFHLKADNIRIIKPEAAINPSEMQSSPFHYGGSKFRLYLPVVEIEQGLLRVVYKNELIFFDNINMSMKDRQLTIHDVHISSPFIKASLTGKVYRPGELMGNKLDLNLETETFKYEQLVKYLPAEHFQDWLKDLLFKQIRRGNARIVSMRYKGRLSELLNVETFFKNIYIEGELQGQRFGAGLGPERVSDIRGKVIFSNDNLSFYNLTGYIGNSKIKSVDLIFPELSKPGTSVTVTADLNMKLRDFVDTWRAAIPPENVHDMLNPATAIETGTLTGKATYKYNGYDNTSTAEGLLKVEDATFNWGTHNLKHISGNAVSKQVGGPLKIEVKGLFNDLPIQLLNLSVDDPFTKKTYSFSLKTNGLPEIKAFRFDNETVITYSGTGDGSAISGNVDIMSKGFTLFGTDYCPVKGDITGKGLLTGILGTETVIDLNSVKINTQPGTISVDSRITGKGGSVFIKGDFDLKARKAFENNEKLPFKGIIDMYLAWRDGKIISGHIDSDEIFMSYGDTPMVVDGSMDIEENELTADHLKIKAGKSKTDITGRLSLTDPVKFNGQISIDGMVLGAGGGKSFNGLEAFEGKADIALTDMDLYGKKIKKATATATYKDNSLKLKKIQIKEITGEGKGSVTIKLYDKGKYDIMLSMSDAAVNTLFEAVSHEKPWIDGTMSVEGHLWGETGKSTNGEIKLKAKDGNFKKYSVLSKFFGALNFYKLIKSGGSVFKEKAFPYNSIKATFNIENNVATFKDFYMDSDSLQMSAVGTYNIKDKQIDAVIGVQPLETVDRAINLLPVIGWVLTGDKGRLIVASFKMHGNIDDPAVEAAPVDSVATPVVESLVRILKLPAQIITNPKQLLPGTKE